MATDTLDPEHLQALAREGTKLLRALLRAGVPMPHRYIIYVEWVSRGNPLLRAKLLESLKSMKKPRL
jgi:hypothetical protein